MIIYQLICTLYWDMLCLYLKLHSVCYSIRSGEKLYQIRMFLRRKVSRCECMKEVDLFCVNTERVSCDIGYNQVEILSL